MFQKRCFRIGILASILICGLLVGCGPSAEEQAATSVALTVTAETDWTIPADFDTFSDESGTFSISYPSDWDLGRKHLIGIFIVGISLSEHRSIY